MGGYSIVYSIVYFLLDYEVPKSSCNDQFILLFFISNLIILMLLMETLVIEAISLGLVFFSRSFRIRRLAF
jgi:hypothetical protein